MITENMNFQDVHFVVAKINREFTPDQHLSERDTFSLTELIKAGKVKVLHAYMNHEANAGVIIIKRL